LGYAPTEPSRLSPIGLSEAGDVAEPDKQKQGGRRFRAKTYRGRARGSATSVHIRERYGQFIGAKWLEPGRGGEG